MLWHILDMLFEKWSYHRNVPDDAHSQLLFSFLMRTIDLLVRHGANPSRDDFGIDKAFQKLIPAVPPFALPCSVAPTAPRPVTAARALPRGSTLHGC